MEETKLFQGEFTRFGKLWDRAIANMIDGFIMVLPIIVCSMVVVFTAGKGPGITEQDSIGYVTIFFILVLITALLYYTCFIGGTGQTPGKKNQGLKVVGADGNVIRYKKAFLRALVFLIYAIPKNIGLLLYIISAIVAAKDTQKRTFHDRICKTFVIAKSLKSFVINK